MGDIYYIHPIHFGIASGFANYPPNRMRGITIIGAKAAASASFSNILDIK
jgi:hypothetical protein